MHGTTPKDTPDIDEKLEGLSAEELFLMGGQHFRAREYALARECFERYIDLVPSDARACHLLARVYYHENDNLDKAGECIENAVRLDPSSASRFLGTLAEIYIHLGEYGRAEEALDKAVRKDPGDDPKHSYTLEFYRNLIRRKTGGGPKPDKNEEDGFEGYSARKDARRRSKWDYLFIPGSILVHIIVILLMGYISGMDLPARDRFEEDFTFIDVDYGDGLEQDYGPEDAQGQYEPAEGVPAPGPGPVQTRAPGKAAATASAPVGPLDFAAEDNRALSAQKAAAGLESAPLPDATRMAALDVADKSIDLDRRASVMERPEVDLSPRALDIDAGSREGPARSEPKTGSISERRSTAAAGLPKAPEVDRPSGDRAADPAGRKESSPLMTPVHTAEAAPAPKDAAEKTLSIDSPTARPDALPHTAAIRSAPRALDIAPSGERSAASAGKASSETFRTVDRGGASVAPRAQSSAVFDQSGARPGPSSTSAKKSSRFDVSASRAGAAPEFNAASERTARLDTAPASRGFSRTQAAPAPRELGISTASSGTASSAARRASPGAPAGIGEKRSAAAGPLSGGRDVPVSDGASRGYSGAGASGKRAPTGALSGGRVAGRAPGVSSGKKKAGLSGRRAARRASPVPGASPKRAAGLEGLVKETGSGGKGKAAGGADGAGVKPGVKLGTGEKAEPTVSPDKELGGAPKGGGESGTVPGGKKSAEGALGVPGGKGKDKYASISKTKAGPIAPEKLPGVKVESKGGPKGAFGPTVRIVSPAPGKTSQLTQVVTGLVSDPRLTKATLSVNNDSRVVSVVGGRFEAAVALTEGKNVITVMAFDSDANSGKDSVTLEYRPAQGPVPVKITEPKNGQIFDVSRGNTVKVRGMIGDNTIKRARMVLNGRTKDVAVKSGRFSQEVALTQEQNIVAVEVVDEEGEVSSSGLISFGTINVKPKDIMVILTWDKPNADFDLHVYGPLGGHTYYKSPNVYESDSAVAGAQLEQDAKGNYGPEVFTMEEADKGIYTIKSNYYYSGGDGDANATVTVVLFGDNPARRIVRVFGPHLQVDTKTGEEMWDVARFKMPEGIFLED